MVEPYELKDLAYVLGESNEIYRAALAWQNKTLNDLVKTCNEAGLLTNVTIYQAMGKLIQRLSGKV